MANINKLRHAQGNSNHYYCIANMQTGRGWLTYLG